MIAEGHCLNRRMRGPRRRPARERRERRRKFQSAWRGPTADLRSANNDVEFSDDEPDLNDESAVRLYA